MISEMLFFQKIPAENSPLPLRGGREKMNIL
jgi:hypothetical protein